MKVSAVGSHHDGRPDESQEGRVPREVLERRPEVWSRSEIKAKACLKKSSSSKLNTGALKIALNVCESFQVFQSTVLTKLRHIWLFSGYDTYKLTVESTTTFLCDAARQIYSTCMQTEPEKTLNDQLESIRLCGSLPGLCWRRTAEKEPNTTEKEK